MDSKLFLELLAAQGIDFFTGVPDSYLHGFCKEVDRCCEEGHNVIASNEGNAVAIATGYHLATGRIPLVYMQNSGLGNAMNPLASLAGKEMLGVPMVLLIGWRGDPWHRDHVQHELQGRITPTVLQNLEIPYEVLSNEESKTIQAVLKAKWVAEETSAPFALLSPQGLLSGKKVLFSEKKSYLLSREEAIEAILDVVPPGTVFVATTGRASRELFHLRRKRREGHEADVLNVGAMGHASSIAYGLALGQPERTVICLDGDAAMLMHMGALAAPSRSSVPNLLHVVLNNGMHESVGGEPSVAWDVDFTKIACGCGYGTVGRPISTKEDIAVSVRALSFENKAGFIDVRVRPGIRPELPSFDVEPKEMKAAVSLYLRAVE